MSLLNIDSLVLAEDTKCVEPEEIKIIIHNVAVFLPGESHGQRDLAGHSPRGLKEADTAEQLTHTRVASMSFMFSFPFCHSNPMGGDVE